MFRSLLLLTVLCVGCSAFPWESVWTLDQRHRLHDMIEFFGVGIAFAALLMAAAVGRYRADGAILAVSLAMAVTGTMDALHGAVSAGLLYPDAPKGFIPVTFAASRLADSAITGATLVYLTYWRRRSYPSERVSLGIVLGLAALGMGAVHLAAHMPSLDWALPDPIAGAIYRPLDLISLMIYLILGLSIYPRIYYRAPSAVTLGLWLSVLPDAWTQATMAFGASSDYGHSFMAGHGTRLIAYLTPLCGLVLDARTSAQKAARIDQNLDELDRIQRDLARHA